MELKQIYDVQNLKLRFKTKKALEIKTLKFHNGLIYGICGNFGSGKTFNKIKTYKKDWCFEHTNEALLSGTTPFTKISIL